MLYMPDNGYYHLPDMTLENKDRYIIEAAKSFLSESVKKRMMRTLIKPYRWYQYALFPFRQPNREALSRLLSHKTILITGASYGIGEALATMLVGTNVHLILVARTQDKLLALQQQIEPYVASCQIFIADLSCQNQTQSLIDYVKQRPNGIDIFINNAGKSICRSIADSADRLHDFQRTMALNYFAPVQLSIGLLPILKRHQGQIINISALNVLLAPAPYWAAYQASKSAFDQWIHCAEPELKLANISLTSIYFPLVDTRMIQPTYGNKSVPTISAQHAALVICRAIETRKPCFKPLWAIWGQLGSVLFNRLWVAGCTYYLTRNAQHKNDK